MRNHPH